jgi:hypothetical protein
VRADTTQAPRTKSIKPRTGTFFFGCSFSSLGDTKQANPTREMSVKKPGWLRWNRGEEPGNSSAEKLKNVRRRTDQKIRQQEAQKERRDEQKKMSSKDA